MNFEDKYFIKFKFTGEQIRIKSIPGHHIKLIEKTAEILKDGAVYDKGVLAKIKKVIFE